MLAFTAPPCDCHGIDGVSPRPSHYNLHGLLPIDLFTMLGVISAVYHIPLFPRHDEAYILFDPSKQVDRTNWVVALAIHPIRGRVGLTKLRRVASVLGVRAGRGLQVSQTVRTNNDAAGHFYTQPLGTHTHPSPCLGTHHNRRQRSALLTVCRLCLRLRLRLRVHLSFSSQQAMKMAMITMESAVVPLETTSRSSTRFATSRGI